jgi:hypothetical protein
MEEKRYKKSNHIRYTFSEFTKDFYLYLKQENIFIDRKNWDIWIVTPSRVRENIRDKDAIIDNFTSKEI